MLTPFTLLSFEGNQTCFYKYEGEMHLSVMKQDKNHCSLTVVENVYESLLTSTGKSTCSDTSSPNPWVKDDCRPSSQLVPQIKRLGATNIIYCKGMVIQTAGGISQPCPEFAFTMSVKQSFRINNHTFTGMETTINSNQEVNMHLQNKVNTQLHPGLNPYHVVITSGGVDLTHSKVRSDLIIFQENRGPTLLTICTLIFIILLLIGYMQRDRIRNLFSKVRAAAPEIREAIPDARAAEPAERAAVPNARAAVPIAPAAEQGQFNLRL